MVKKSQNWSVETIFSVGFFLTIIVISFVVIYNLPNSNSESVSSVAISALNHVENDLGININNEIDNSKLIDLATEVNSSSELGTRLNVNGDVCIILETLDGRKIPIRKKEGNSLVEIPGIGVNDTYVCGGN